MGSAESRALAKSAAGKREAELRRQQSSKAALVELHTAQEHVGIFREIIRPLGRAPMLAAVETLDGSFANSPYAKVLDACGL